ncbi:MAG TPA: Ig-like domain-containing protein, partial [Candidatus Limnocylindria bacterium]|nr:Ig-like domain-containing protein [Candidatus Limnocylindria bacterium]
FQLSAAAAAGTFTIAISGVQDRDGDVIAAGTTARVTIADEGRPRVLRAESSGDAITVSFSEPMLLIGEGSGVTMAANYRLDGSTTPVSAISCLDGGCRTVRLALRAGALVAGRTYELRIANVVDRAGRNITPDPTTLSLVAR